MTDPQSTIRHVVGELRSRDLADLAIRPVKEGDIAAMMLRHSIRVTQDDFSFSHATAVRRDAAGSFHVLVHERAPRWKKRIVIARAIALAVHPARLREDPSLATVAALCDALNARDLARYGDRLVSLVRARLARLPEVWGHRTPMQLVELALQEVRSIQRTRAEVARQRALAARNAGYFLAASIWFCRSVEAARVGRDRATEALSLVGLGKTHELMGDHVRATRALRRAARIAKVLRERETYAFALHHLTAIAIEEGALSLIGKRARATFRAYPERSPYRAVLAKDIAGHWILLGEFQRACSALSAVAPHMVGRDNQLACYALLARAAGNCGRSALYTRATLAADDLLRDAPVTAVTAQAHYNLGWGAYGAGFYERARVHAETACRLSAEQGSPLLLNAARQLRGLALEGRPVEWLVRDLDSEADAFLSEVVEFFGRRQAPPPATPA